MGVVLEVMVTRVAENFEGFLHGSAAGATHAHRENLHGNGARAGSRVSSVISGKQLGMASAEFGVGRHSFYLGTDVDIGEFDKKMARSFKVCVKVADVKFSWARVLY